MFEVDLRSRVPIYEQLYENIRKHILQGIIVEDERIPSVRELASQLTINPNTIQKAYKALEKDGYIYSVSGRGNFVNKLDGEMIDHEAKEALKKLCKVIKEVKLVGVSLENIIEVTQACYEEEKND